MTRTKSASEFKAKCLGLIDEVAATGEPITILKRGKPVARLMPVPPAGKGAPQDRLKGTVTFLGDVVSPATEPDDWDAVSGRGW